MVNLIINKFVIKETRRALKSLEYSQEKIGYCIDYIRECCTVTKNVSKEELRNIHVRDKNDKPILASALKTSDYLVTEDHILIRDAQKSIECLTPTEALQKIKELGKK